MIWWLLGLLAGGALLLSNQGSDEPFFLAVNPKESLFKLNKISSEDALAVSESMKKRGYSWKEGYEKFRDPRIPRCFGVAGSENPYKVADTGSASGLPSFTGWWQFPSENSGCRWDENKCSYLNFPVVGDALEYIGAVPPTAFKRIAVLKDKVENNTFSKESLVLDSISYQSTILLENSLMDLYSSFKDKAKLQSLADKAGIPVSELISKESNIEKAIDVWTKDKLHISVLSVFQDLKKELGGIISDVIKSFSDKFSKEVSMAGDAVSKISEIAGPFMIVFNFAYKNWQDSQAQVNAAVDRYNQAFVKRIFEITGLIQDRGYPLPWHIVDNWPTILKKRGEAGYNDMGDAGGFELPSIDLSGAREDATYAFLMWYNMGIANKTNVIKWWSSTMTIMADPVNFAVFNAMGRNRGLFASDEQVLSVATPIALLNGYDPYEFAQLLWGYAEGWADPLGKPDWWAFDKKTWIEGPKEKDGSRIGKPVSPCSEKVEGDPIPQIPMNAWALNFASLTRCAFDLVDALKEKDVKLVGVKKAPEFFIPLTVKL